MSKADQPISTPASGLNRREALVAAAATAALVAIIPNTSIAAAAATDPSDMLPTARRLATLRWDAFGASADCADHSPERQRYDELADDYDEALDELFDRKVAKPTPTPSDVAALAIIARAWQAEDPAGIEDDLAAAEDRDDRAMLQLMASVLAMAEGGANV